MDPVGVCHADDLFYIWQSDDFPLPVEDALVSDTITSAWVNFAMYGDPTPPGSDIFWAPVNPAESNILQFWNISDLSPSMQRNEKLQERMNLWDMVMDIED